MPSAFFVLASLPGCASTAAPQNPKSVSVDVAPLPAPVETTFRGAITVDAASLGPDDLDGTTIANNARGDMKAFVGCLRHEAPKPVDAWVVARVNDAGAVDFTATDSSVRESVAPCVSSVAKGLKFEAKTFAVSLFLHAEPAPSDCKGDDCVFIPTPAEAPPNAEADAALQNAVEGGAPVGMIGLLGAPPDNTPFGTLQGADIGEAFGVGGLGLTGTGEGAGGRGEGIGLGALGTFGRGSGTGTGIGLGGIGTGQGPLSGSHRGKSPALRIGAASVSGRLPPEVIKRIVRQHFGQIRLCYEKGLATDPKLEGRVTTTFVIAKTGDVTSVADAKSDLANATVIQCVDKVFAALKFPEPEGGIVKVTYPIDLSPGHDPPPQPVWTVGGEHFPALGADAAEKKLKSAGWHTLAVPAEKPGAPFAVFAFKERGPEVSSASDDGFATSVTWGPENGARSDAQRDSEGIRLRFDGRQATSLDHDLVDPDAGKACRGSLTRTTRSRIGLADLKSFRRMRELTFVEPGRVEFRREARNRKSRGRKKRSCARSGRPSRCDPRLRHRTRSSARRRSLRRRPRGDGRGRRRGRRGSKRRAGRRRRGSVSNSVRRVRSLSQEPRRVLQGSSEARGLRSLPTLGEGVRRSRER